MDIAIMIEGQNGLTWPRWKRIVTAVESLGFAGLYRSDHFTNASPPDIDSLECWISLAYLAGNTSRIAFGPLVSPFSFRHPAMLARYARDVDDLSGGRLNLGLGAGWQVREHENYGLDLLDMNGRFTRFEEGLEVISRLFSAEEPANFEGEFYQLREASFLPRPARPNGPDILIGGNGERRTLPLAARFASMWNAVYITPADFMRKSIILDGLLRAQGRESDEVHRSLMTGLYYGETDAAVSAKLGGRDRDALAGRGVVIGTPGEVIDQLGVYADAGVERIILQWLDLNDIDGLESLAHRVNDHLN